MPRCIIVTVSSLCDDVVCVHRLKASETGDYSFCFDNSFSRFSKKVVFFELFIASDDDDDDDDDAAQYADAHDNSDYDFKLEDFKVTETVAFKTEEMVINNSLCLQQWQQLFVDITGMVVQFAAWLSNEKSRV